MLRHRWQNVIWFRRTVCRHQFIGAYQRLAQNRHMAGDLAAATSRHDENRRSAIAERKAFTGRLWAQAIEFVNQWVADIDRGRSTEPFVRFDLKRQQHQQMVDVSVHLRGPALPPRPDRWRYPTDNWDVRRRLAHPLGDAVGEVRTVNQDNNIWLGDDDRVSRLLDPPQDHRQPRHHRR